MGAKTCKGKAKYPNLLSPLRVNGLRFKNRIFASATSPAMMTNEGHFTPEMIAYLEEKAIGGAALVTYGEAIVHSATGKSHNRQLQLDSEGVRQGLANATRAIHNHGAYASIQLSHGGMYGGLASVGGDRGVCEVAYGPSKCTMPAGEVEEMPKELIYEIVESYGKAAKLCKDCGFDMVQVHAAHGWLFSQFLSPVINQRTDEFGGSLENRARFLMMALDAVRAAVGPIFPIEIRISGSDMTDRGMTDEECLEVCKMVDSKVDMFNVSVGNHEDPDIFCRTHPSAFYPRGVNVPYAARVKQVVTKPVNAVGSMIDPEQMEELIATGQCDAVAIGRGLLADPFIPAKAIDDNAEDITPCIRCYECFGETALSESVKCTVNPEMGQQLWCKTGIKPVGPSKKVLVVGGGPGGMEAAITAARRGHDVTLVEKADKLGGNLHPAGAAFFKEDIRRFNKVLQKRLAESGAKVILNTAVTPEFVKEFDPDALIVAIGANELRPPIKGMDMPHVVMATEAEMNPEIVGKKVVIMGGGLVGGEVAVGLHHEGKEVAIVEMKDRIAADVNSFYRGGLIVEIEKSADCYTNTKVKEIVPEGVRVEGPDGNEFVIEADSVLCALGFRAPWAQVDELLDLVDESYAVGNCRNVGFIHHAVNQGYYTALKL